MHGRTPALLETPAYLGLGMGASMKPIAARLVCNVWAADRPTNHRERCARSSARTS